MKADIKHYFETVDHEILLRTIKWKIKDEDVIWLITAILGNHRTLAPGRGMPLGNLTSQFFANVYLNELDYFVKHKLKARHYIRCVDDFVLLHEDRKVLEKWKNETDEFLEKNLKIELHPEKSRTIPLRKGITLLGFRVFYHYKLLKKSNTRRIWKRLERLKQKYDEGEIERKKIVESLEGWLAYAEFANSYNFRRKVVARFNEFFGTQSVEE